MRATGRRRDFKQRVSYAGTLVPHQAPRWWRPSPYGLNAESNKGLIISPDDQSMQEPDNEQLISARMDMQGEPVSQDRTSRQTNTVGLCNVACVAVKGWKTHSSGAVWIKVPSENAHLWHFTYGSYYEAFVLHTLANLLAFPNGMDVAFN